MRKKLKYKRSRMTDCFKNSKINLITMFSTKTYKICYQFPEMLYINTLKNKMNVEFSMLHFLQDKHDLRNEFNKFLLIDVSKK